jgi:hypothetical protein
MLLALQDPNTAPADREIAEAAVARVRAQNTRLEAYVDIEPSV